MNIVEVRTKLGFDMDDSAVYFNKKSIEVLWHQAKRSLGDLASPCLYCLPRSSPRRNLHFWAARDHYGTWRHCLVCRACGANGPQRDRQSEALVAWNDAWERRNTPRRY